MTDAFLPLPGKEHIPSEDPESFLSRDWRLQTEIPLGRLPGAFGSVRRHHRHEGIDLYAPDGALVAAIEPSRIVRIAPFTGPEAGSPWWESTWAVLAEDVHGLWNYGEISPADGLREGSLLEPGQIVGSVARVLRRDKGRPTSMLHLERYAPGASGWIGVWALDEPRPAALLDPCERLRLLFPGIFLPSDSPLG